MRVVLDGVEKGRDGIALPSTTLEYASGHATLIVAETAQRPTVLGLIAAGRMSPDAGTVWLDGKTGRRPLSALRRRVALIDAPDVSEPAPNIIVAGVVAEELMFAGRASDPLAVRRWLDANGLRASSRVPIADLSSTERIRMLLELAAARPGVDGLVLVSPDRHGGDPAAWWALAHEFAERGLAVLVIAGEAASVAITAADEKARESAASRARLRPSRVRPHMRGAARDLSQGGAR